MPYYPPSGGGGGSGTPGGSDTQIQVNSQNAFAGFPNLRWIGSSNSLDLNTAGRIRHGGVAEVDGVAPVGVTGLIWLDTSASSFTSSSAGLAGTGPSYILQSGNSTLPNSQVLTSGSSTTVRTDGTGKIYVDASTGGGGGASAFDFNYYRQVQSNSNLAQSPSKSRLYSSPGIDIGATTTYSTNSAFFTPFVVPVNFSVDSMALNIVTAGSFGTTVQLAIYANSQNNYLYPTSLVISSALLNGSGTGVRVFNPSVTLTANNLYWLCLSIRAGSIQATSVANPFPIFGFNDSFQNAGIGLMLGTSGGVLPATITLSANVIAPGVTNPAAIPMLLIRASA